MPNLPTLITTGSFSRRAQTSNEGQSCSKGRFPLHGSPKSVMEDVAIVSPESASNSDSMEHCIPGDMHCRRLRHDTEDITSGSSAASSFKRTSEAPKISTELLCEQKDADLYFRNLLQASSSEVNEPLSGLDHKTFDQYHETVSINSRSSMASAGDLESHRSSWSLTSNGTLGYPPSMVSEKREIENDDLEISELAENREWRQVSLFYINSEHALNQDAKFLTRQVPASKIANASEATTRKVSLAASESQGEKPKSNRQNTTALLFSDSEGTKSFDYPRSASTHFSKLQHANASITNSRKARNESTVTPVKSERYSPRNMPFKAINPSSKPSPSKWEDAQKWLISSISGDIHQQTDNPRISSPRLSFTLPYSSEVVRKVKSSDTEHTVCRAPAENKLENPSSQGRLGHMQALDKRTSSTCGNVLKNGEIAEKPCPGFDQKQWPLLESRSANVTDTRKLSIVHPPIIHDKGFQSALTFPKNNLESTVPNTSQSALAHTTYTAKLPAGVGSDPSDLRKTERAFHTALESRVTSTMLSNDVHTTDKYADTDHSPPAPNNKYFAQTQKLGDSLPMKDVSTEITELVSRYRDMGTQMTPHSSSRPSKCTTPNSSISPARHNTPAKQTASLGHASLDLLKLQSCQLMEKLEHQNLSLQCNFNTFERTTSNTWSSREEEEEECSKSLRYLDLPEIRRSVIQARAAAWEEAEQAKSKARYKREESKIQAWENHQKAKAEAEMRKLEVKLDKMRSRRTEKIMNKLSAAHRHAENMKAAAQAERAEQLTRSKERANQMRLNGHVPTPIYACFTSHT